MNEPPAPSTRDILVICAILVVAAALRFWWAAGLPLSGDEVGVGVLQASGQAVTYADRLPGAIVPLDEIRGFVAYDPRFSPRDVLRSLREAGMHPPLYYLTLHYVLRFFGNDGATLRALSIVFSVAAVGMLYLLGRALAGNAIGLSAAALLAVAPYGVQWGSLVRPYPAAMLMSVASTLVTLRFATHPSGPRFAAWLLLSVAGLYTIYQYAFVIGFQILHLALASRRARDLVTLAALATAIVIAYLPWMPTLVAHLVDVTTHAYYFHRELDVTRLRTEFVSPLGAIGLVGLAILVVDRATRSFALALVAYGVAYLAVEARLGMSTATEPKFLFFAVPATLLCVAVALRRLPRRIAGLAAWCAVGVLFGMSAMSCVERDRITADAEEIYARDFRPLLDGDRSGRLLVVNTMQRRYLFPLVHAIGGAGDAYVIPESGTPVLPGNAELARYERIVLVDFYVDYEPRSFLDEARRQAFAAMLVARGYVPAGVVYSGSATPRNVLLAFERVSARLPGRP